MLDDGQVGNALDQHTIAHEKLESIVWKSRAPPYLRIDLVPDVNILPHTCVARICEIFHLERVVQ